MPSITEQEFDYAQLRKKICLCYIVDEQHPWIPSHVDSGEDAAALSGLKRKINTLVRSKFTTPDNLAKQVAADLARFSDSTDSKSVGSLLRVNWDVFAPELQVVLTTAYSQAKQDSRDGVVATRHVVAALAELPNTAQPLIRAFPKVELPTLKPGVPSADVAEMYLYNRPFSSCVLGSMERLLPKHSATEQLLAIELAVDLLKNGHGESVAKFRDAGVDGVAVGKVEDHIRAIATDVSVLKRGLEELADAEIIHLAYITNLPLTAGLSGRPLRDYVLAHSQRRGVNLYLAGELLRRHPRLVGL